MVQPRIENTPEKKLAGLHIITSLADNKTPELWRSFMPIRKEISNSIGMELYSMDIYPFGYFDNFSPATKFEKWAAVEVKDFAEIPTGFETYTLPSGLYAVFTYKGLPSNGAEFYQYIFGTWLPSSAYISDNRPHLAVMGEKYKNAGPDSEEELWIPVKPRINS